MDVSRRWFIGGSVAFAAMSARAGACFWEKALLPAGVDRKPLWTNDLPLDDSRRRQNQFLPDRGRDANSLSFASDGTFTFFQITDLHEQRRAIGERERVLFESACERFAPSLVLLTGDQVDFRCRGLFEDSAAAVVRLLTDAKLPFALTFGNHDTELIGEGWLTAAEQWAFYRQVGGGLFVDRHDPSVPGGCSCVSIEDVNGRPAFNLCLIDSGDYGPPNGTGRRNFDSVRAPSVAWAQRTLARNVPSLFFQHIIVPEVRDAVGRGLFREVEPGTPGAQACAEWSRPCVVDERHARGVLGEGVGSTSVSTASDPVYLHQGKSIYDVWKSSPSFRGAYFGHDHKNSFDGLTRDGVRLGVTKTMGTCAYNDGDLALRVFRLHRDGSYETELVSEGKPHGAVGWMATSKSAPSVSHGAVCLTFDDRNFNGWRKALPVLRKYGAHATFSICGSIDASAIKMMRELQNEGHSLGLHGQKHQIATKALECMGANRYLDDEIAPQLSAVRAAGLNVRNWAYPMSERSVATDTVLGLFFRRMRTGCLWRKDIAGDPMRDHDELFMPAHESAGRRILYGTPIPSTSRNWFEDVAGALGRAARRNEIFVLYTHNVRTDGRSDSHDISLEQLELLLSEAARLGVRMIGFDDLA